MTDPETNLRYHATQIAFETHGDAIDAALTAAKNRLLDDLANLYLAQLRGKPMPIPHSVTIGDIHVNLHPQEGARE